MRYLLDENTPPRLAELLRERGYDALHVREAGRRGLSDAAQLAFAAEQDRVFVSRDYDDMPRLTRTFFLEHRPHRGVVILPVSLPNTDVGGCLAAIIQFDQEFGVVDPYHLSWLRPVRPSPG